ncbi:MAG: inorganic phosphate transporter [Legionellales bacterium]|nr:inorganic phosphate transporter [Legionellales bacterium]
MEFGTYYLIFAGVIGFVMACGVGANDVANAIGTSVGAKALSIRQAIIIASIFEGLGAMLAGGEVTSTIRSQIIDPSFIEGNQEMLIHGMLAASLSAGIWLLIASYKGWPVSTTHTLIGAIIGFGSFTLGIDAISWGTIVDIVLSWVVTPVIAGIIAYIVFYTIQVTILNRRNPLKYAKKFLPFYVGTSSMITIYITVSKGMNHLGIDLVELYEIILTLILSSLITFISLLMLKKIPVPHDDEVPYDYRRVEKYFGILMILTACSMAFAHGANDVANAIGPLAVVVDLVHGIPSHHTMPFWILLVGAMGIIVGLVTYGYKIIITIGENITVLTPSRGFSAEISAASTVIIASSIGLPVSTTQTLVGAILGGGLAGGIGAINLNVIRNIFFSWLITLPAGAVISIVLYYIVSHIFNVT